MGQHGGGSCPLPSPGGRGPKDEPPRQSRCLGRLSRAAAAAMRPVTRGLTQRVSPRAAAEPRGQAAPRTPAPGPGKGLPLPLRGAPRSPPAPLGVTARSQTTGRKEGRREGGTGTAPGPGPAAAPALTGSGVSTTSLTAPPRQGRHSPMAGPTAGAAARPRERKRRQRPRPWLRQGPPRHGAGGGPTRRGGRAWPAEGSGGRAAQGPAARGGGGQGGPAPVPPRELNSIKSILSGQRDRSLAEEQLAPVNPARGLGACGRRCRRSKRPRCPVRCCRLLGAAGHGGAAAPGSGTGARRGGEPGPGLPCRAAPALRDALTPLWWRRCHRIQLGRTSGTTRSRRSWQEPGLDTAAQHLPSCISTAPGVGDIPASPGRGSQWLIVLVVNNVPLGCNLPGSNLCLSSVRCDSLSHVRPYHHVPVFKGWL